MDPQLLEERPVMIPGPDLASVDHVINPQYTPDGMLVDFLTGDVLPDQPEERVRQRYIRILHHQYEYRKSVLARQVAIYYGGQPARDRAGNPVFADVVVYESPEACAQRDQGAIRLVVETKAPDEQTGHNQLVSYVFNTSSNGAVWHNGEQTKWYRRLQTPEQKLIPWPGIPRANEPWDAVGRRRKEELQPLLDVRATLERCHNKLHRRGSEGDDLTMDMVRLLLAKARDEERDEPDTSFYCSPVEYDSDQGRRVVAERVEQLFEEVRDSNPTVFEPAEHIRVGDRQVVDVVAELQDYKLIGDDDVQWDVMGAAYEQYTADVLKREGGEFFTNRLIISLLTRIVDPRPDHTVLDPAGGTGGFCTAAIRHMRDAIRGSAASESVKRHRMEQIRDRIFYIDVKHRLVKIAKAAMILTGNGHRGFTQGDSLAPFERLPEHFRGSCRFGQVDRVLTNPPFAGTTNGKIDAPAEMAPQFQLAQRWHWQDARYLPTGEPLAGGVPPELLFIERSIQWIRPGGVIGIVVPKGVVENPDITLATRHFIFRHTFVRAVITCHKDTFQPYTGSRTTLLILEKKQSDRVALPDHDYSIFMAVSRKIGQDSEGRPIFTRDDDGRATSTIDHDLDDIYDAWQQHQSGRLETSEYTFSVLRSSLNERSLIISPQYFLPSLNEAIAEVLRLGDQEGWTATPLGDLARKVYKGSRFKREDLETESAEGPDVVRYYTPAALLQDHAESVKLLDLGRAEKGRRDEIERHRLGRLDLLVTRSGTVGRVILTTRDHVGHIGSDDLIHIDVIDENLRAYIYQFLKSDLGQKQLRKNEYGTIQQHLESTHVREVLIPVPKNDSRLIAVATQVLQAVAAKEESIERERQASALLSDELK